MNELNSYEGLWNITYVKLCVSNMIDGTRLNIFVSKTEVKI